MNASPTSGGRRCELFQADTQRRRPRFARGGGGLSGGAAPRPGGRHREADRRSLLWCHRLPRDGHVLSDRDRGHRADTLPGSRDRIRKEATMTTSRLCTTFNTAGQVSQPKLGNQLREERRTGNTRLYLTADYKRCSARRAAHLSSRRPRRPATVATSSRLMQPQHQRRLSNWRVAQ